MQILEYSALRAWLFDLDGVITDTAAVHSRAWQRLFDEFLASRNTAGEDTRPFCLPDDYVRYLDGKLRYEGVRSFLESRGIELPWGSVGDSPQSPTVCGLGNRKNDFFTEVLEREGVPVIESTVSVIRTLREHGIKTACVSSSKNVRPVLEKAGLFDLFDVLVGGYDLEHYRLRGKPEPDGFLFAAELLEASPDEAVVVEDALVGVSAGHAGGFAVVVAINRGAGREALLGAGADIVVEALDERIFSEAELLAK